MTAPLCQWRRVKDSFCNMLPDIEIPWNHITCPCIIVGEDRIAQVVGDKAKYNKFGGL